MKEFKELKELRKQNIKLRELVKLYNNGMSKIVLCSKCNIPLQSNEDRIRIVYNKRNDGYSDRQIATFHTKCFNVHYNNLLRVKE
jgi:exonuclease VII small subunit